MKPTPEEIEETIRRWDCLGQHYNEDWGVGSIYTKVIAGHRAYAALAWIHGNSFFEWAVWNGRMVDDSELCELLINEEASDQ